jgi:hypothetical protein
MTELEKSISKYNSFFSDKYEKYVGNLEDLSIIEQYSRITAFWIMEMDLFEIKTFTNDYNKQVYYAYSKSGYLNIRDKTLLLDKKTKLLIAEKVKSYHILYHMKMKLEKIMKIAFDLYHKTIQNQKYKHIPDPNKLLLIQDKIREIWITHEKDIIEEDDMCSRYIKFMYYNFPENYGKMLQKTKKCPEQIYFELVYKNIDKPFTLNDIIEV